MDHLNSFYVALRTISFDLKNVSLFFISVSGFYSGYGAGKFQDAIVSSNRENRAKRYADMNKVDKMLLNGRAKTAN